MTFPTPRPKAAEGPSKAPRRTNHSRAPIEGSLRVLGPVELHDEAKAHREYEERMAAIALLDHQRKRASRNRSKTPAEQAKMAGTGPWSHS